MYVCENFESQLDENMCIFKRGATRRQCSANWQSRDNEEARPVKPLEQGKIFKNMVKYWSLDNAMETRDHSKNGASLKSHTSRKNINFFCNLVVIFK